MTTQRNFLLAIAIILFTSWTASAQIQYDFGFQRDQSIPVYKAPGQPLSLPWTGGFNSVHFNQMDLNFDGIKDLLVFDASTDRLLTFINRGTANSVDYQYAPEYEIMFPKLYSWIKLIDFNGDGKEDLFTYGFAGIKVYLNTSSPTSGISFSLYTPILNAQQGGGVSNILSTPVDYPAIADLDGDGDLDFLVFYGMGSLIDHYKNHSVENSGNPDSLWLIKESRCWGWVSENSDDNGLTINIDSIDPTLIPYCMFNMKSSKSQTDQSPPKHTGSTMLMLDLTGNGLMDMLLGDTDYPMVQALYNTGTLDSARITFIDTLFPSSNVPVILYHLPTTDFLDVDNDGKKDLLVGSMDPSWEYPKGDNLNSAWWYKNTGTNNLPVFSLQTKGFLQEEMFDVGINSFPVLYDYNGDSLLDLFIGGYGIRDSSSMDPWGNLSSTYVSSIWLYENTGTATHPEFTFVTDDFAGYSSLNRCGAYPTFGDLNGNGKPDMLVGDTTGRLHHYENTAPAGQPMQMSYVGSNYQNIDVGMYSMPQLFDLDQDGLLDLSIGYRGKSFTHDSINYRWNTSIAYYKNTGTATNPQFTWQTDTLGGVRTNDSYHHYYYGYSAPCFFRDTAGVTSLFVGSGPGLVFYFRDIDSNLTGFFGRDSNMVHITDYDQHYSVQHFENDDNNPQTIDMKVRSTIAIADINGDGYPDMIIGNQLGGLNFFKGTPPLGVGIHEPMKAFAGEVSLFPNPATSIVNIAITGADRSIRTTSSVYSITGQLLMQNQQQGDDLFQLDISGLTNGLYVLRIDVQSTLNGTIGTFSKKLVVKR